MTRGPYNGHSLVDPINRNRHTAMKHKPLISEEEFNKRHDKALRDADPSYKKKTKPKPKKDIEAVEEYIRQNVDGELTDF